MKINPLYIHVIFGVGVVAVVTLLSIRGVLVSPQFAPLSVTEFLKPQTYTALKNTPPEPDLTQLYFLDQGKVTTATGKSIVALPEKNKQAIVQDQLHYDSNQNTRSYLSCNPYCSVVIFNSESNSEVASIPLFTDPSYTASLKEVRLLFVDVVHELIGYQVADSEVIVISFDKDLLQNVRLENERNTVVYLGYIPETKQMAFELVEKSGAYKQLALYSADSPSLQLLQKVPIETKIIVLGKSKTLSVGTNLIDLSGAVLMELNSNQVISVQ